MGVYFGETEITGMHFGEQEITEIFFGNTEIFSVWGEYDGTLPAQYTANGDYLADYRVYGSAGGVGDDSGTAYGYEVDMSVKSGNLFDVAQTNNGTDYYAGGLHWEIAGQSVTLSETSNTTYPQSFLLDSEGNALQLTAGKTYHAKLFVDNAPAGSSIYIFLRKKVAGVWSVTHTISINDTVIKTPTGVEEWGWLLVAQGNGITYTNTKIRLQVSETPIIEYAPFSNITTPIYIGSNPLEAIGEYTDFVDYGVQKIIRKIIKIEFTGEEYWETYQTKYYIRTLNYINSTWGTTAGFSRCSHFVPSQQADEIGEYSLGGLTQYTWSRWNGNVLFNTGTSLADFKTYLATQKAAGTPVILWYVCEIPIEEDPPIPLPQLPTVDSVNIVDYAGQSAAPSRFYAKYRKEGF